MKDTKNIIDNNDNKYPPERWLTERDKDHNLVWPPESNRLTIVLGQNSLNTQVFDGSGNNLSASILSVDISINGDQFDNIVTIKFLDPIIKKV